MVFQRKYVNAYVLHHILEKYATAREDAQRHLNKTNFIKRMLEVCYLQFISIIHSFLHILYILNKLVASQMERIYRRSFILATN